MNTEELKVNELKECIKLIAKLRQNEAEVNDMKREVTAQLDEAEKRMIEMLTKSGLKNFRSEDGLVSLSARLSVKTPKTEEDRAAFFAYLKSLGLFEQMVSVHSATLNSFYKDQFELARQRGDDDFKIPGLNEETMTPILSFKRG